MNLIGLTRPTAQAVQRRLSDGDRLGAKGTPGAAARGVTWVHVTGAPAGGDVHVGGDLAGAAVSSPASDGWHTAVVTIDQAAEWKDETKEVLVIGADGGPLETGTRYPCTQTGADPDTGKARFRVIDGGNCLSAIDWCSSHPGAAPSGEPYRDITFSDASTYLLDMWQPLAGADTSGFVLWVPAGTGIWELTLGGTLQFAASAGSPGAAYGGLHFSVGLVLLDGSYAVISGPFGTGGLLNGQVVGGHCFGDVWTDSPAAWAREVVVIGYLDTDAGTPVSRDGRDWLIVSARAGIDTTEGTIGITAGRLEFRAHSQMLIGRPLCGLVAQPDPNATTPTVGPLRVRQLVAGAADVRVGTKVTGGLGPYTWDVDWGDGSPHDSGPPPWSHTYAAAGTYTVTVTATDANAATDSNTATVVVT